MTYKLTVFTPVYNNLPGKTLKVNGDWLSGTLAGITGHCCRGHKKPVFTSKPREAVVWNNSTQYNYMVVDWVASSILMHGL